MLFMLIVGASRASEEGRSSDPALMVAMDRYNAELDGAGVRVMARGLHPGGEAVRAAFPVHGGPPVLSEGSSTPLAHRIAGFFLIEVQSREEAVAWLERAPDPQGGGEGWLELRQVHGGSA
jgi:hypothetical protein